MLQSQGFYHNGCYSNIVNERNLERVVHDSLFHDLFMFSTSEV